MTKHTPGPWRAEAGKIRNAQGDMLANYPYTLGDETDHANGRLMAAAPELLELASLTVRTLNDTLRHGFHPGQVDALEDLAKMLREKIAALA